MNTPNERDRQRKATGLDGEARARRYLEAQGLDLIETNYRTRAGEIDLIMADGQTIVFVEVRVRRSRGFGGAAASVTRTKQQKLAQAASHWLLNHGRHAARPCRFDVIAFEGDGPPDWIRGAFEVS
ncbi:putative endonuclease [Luteibacter sp. Sphag1AF]|uniref:YraN family protein n=1 Tax=Luteibacter sp. Sphag1AF TaxID=2587031 RepID=UPI001619FECB|nr:putative endonuclease [Luteibacter sp. Sphag1AF]